MTDTIKLLREKLISGVWAGPEAVDALIEAVERDALRKAAAAILVNNERDSRVRAQADKILALSAKVPS